MKPKTNHPWQKIIADDVQDKEDAKLPKQTLHITLTVGFTSPQRRAIGGTAVPVGELLCRQWIEDVVTEAKKALVVEGK